MTIQFNRHVQLANAAQSQLTKAVTLDEQKRLSEASTAYEKAILLLSSYLDEFNQSTTAFKTLSKEEKLVVEDRKGRINSFLSNARQRRQVLVLHKPSASQTHAGNRVAALGISPKPQMVFRSVGNPARTEKNFQPTKTPNAPSTGTQQTNDALRHAIESEILDASPNVLWDDIYGLGEVKAALNEMVVLPAQRPDLYTGLRAPGKGVLLFGPPGTGKTLIAKAVATNINATFFSISASSLNSKYHGESERLVRTLFQVARERQPSFIFIDEVDSLLGARSDTEHEASRRLKTEFMSQFDGATTSSSAEERVYVMAASNRPQDLDDAVRRRLDRRIYVPLPDFSGRLEFFRMLTSKNAAVKWNLSSSDMETLAYRTVRFSGSDIKALCREASLMPLRELGPHVSNILAEDVRACNISDFEEALQIVRPSSNEKQITELEKWNEEFGSRSRGSRARGSGSSGSGPDDRNSSLSNAEHFKKRITRSMSATRRRAGIPDETAGATARSNARGNDEWLPKIFRSGLR